MTLVMTLVTITTPKPCNKPCNKPCKFAVWALRERFPLHLIIFKQTACHLPHEANVEMLFSRAGLLTDPNMDCWEAGLRLVPAAKSQLCTS